MRIIALFAAILAQALAQLPPKDAGPATLVIHSTVAPSLRAQRSASPQSETVAQFEQWKTSGRLAGYRLLFSRYG